MSDLILLYAIKQLQAAKQPKKKKKANNRLVDNKGNFVELRDGKFYFNGTHEMGEKKK